MRKIIRIFVWALAVLVVMTAGLFTYLRNADLSIYQPQLERMIAKRTGFELRIAGRFQLQFGSVTTVLAQDATLTNPEWHEDTELVRAGHVELAFDTWSLISRPFIVEDFKASDVRIRVDRSADGQSNWQPSASGPGDGGDGGDGRFDLNRIAFRTANVENVHLLYTDESRSRPIDARVRTLTVTPDANDLLDLDLQGDINELPLWADGKLGPWRNFVDGSNISADLIVSLGQVSLETSGRVADLLNLEGVSLMSELSGPDVTRVLERLGLPPFAAGAFAVSAAVQQLDSGHRIRLDGKLGEIELFAAGNVDSLLRPSRARNDFRVAGPDAHHVARLLGIDGVPAEPFQVTGDYSRDGRLISLRGANARIGANTIAFDGRLDFSSRIPDVEMTISASGPNFAVVDAFIPLDGFPAVAWEIDGRVQKSGASWSFGRVSAEVGENSLTVDGTLEVGREATAEIAVHAAGPDISFVEEFTRLQGIPSRPYDIRARLRSDPRGVDLEDTVGRFGDNIIRIDGVLTTRPGFEDSEFSVGVQGPELHNVRLLTGVPHLPAGPFEASGNIRFERSFLVLDGVEATVDELNGGASGRIGLGQYLGFVDLDVTVSGPDASKAAAIEFLQQFGGEPFSVAGNIRYGDDRFEAESLRVSLGALESEITGSIVGPGRSMDMSVNARSPDSMLVRKLAKLNYLPGGEIVVSGEMRKSGDAIDFRDTQLAVGDFHFAADGTLSLVPESNDSDLQFSISGPDLSEIGAVFGSELLPARPFTAAGQFNGTRRGFAMRDFLVTLGGNDLRGQFDVDLRGKPRLMADLSSTYLDVSDSLPASAQETAAEPEAEAAEFLFADTPLDTSLLHHADIELKLSIDRLLANTLNVTDVSIGIDLVDGALQIDPIHLQEGEGGIDGTLSLLPQDGRYALDVSLRTDDLHLGLLAPDSKDNAELPPLTGRLEIRGMGASIDEIMASANGIIAFRQGSGRVKDVFASRIFRDILWQVLRTLNPMRRENDYQTIECGIYEVSIAQGIATIETFVLQTGAMTVVATGTIDLDTEQLDIGFRAKPRQGIGISLGTVANSLLGVGGTLKDPSIGLDAKNSVTTTGAAVATGGLSLLARGLWDRLSAEADACKQEN